jgi:hypothetical protein
MLFSGGRVTRVQKIFSVVGNFDGIFVEMESDSRIRHRKRGMSFLVVSILLLVLGQTILRHTLTNAVFIVYWAVCFICTGLAILFSLLDFASVQRRAREEQRELIEKTVRDIARQKEIKSGRPPPEE